MSLPEAFRVADLLEALPACAVPPEVEATLLSLGFPALKRIRKHKELVLQLLGAELGDKALFDLERPISASSIERASILAQEAGLRVPNVVATGEAEEWGSFQKVPFVLYELIKTATVEDKVVAPQEELCQIIADLKHTLTSRSLAEVETEPLPRFEDCFKFLYYLHGLAKQMQACELVDSCKKMEENLKTLGLTSAEPVLVHQDLNDGNVLCSPDASGRWKFDALIDWEGAVVVDPRIAYDRSEPWLSLRTLAKVTKIRWVAAASSGAVQITTLPRCCAEELIEDYDELAALLVEKGWLSHVEPLPFS